MNDTHPDISARFQNLMMLKSGEQRLLMGCSMYDTAKQIVRSSIYDKYPQISAGQVKKAIVDEDNIFEPKRIAKSFDKAYAKWIAHKSKINPDNILYHVWMFNDRWYRLFDKMEKLGLITKRTEVRGQSNRHYYKIK